MKPPVSSEWLESLNVHVGEGGQIGERAARDLLDEVNRYRELINSPETEDFMKAIPLEAAHQVERWGPDHDKGKSPWDWFWTVGYLAQKAAMSMLSGDLTKAKHHTITVAALMLTWHRVLQADRPSEGPAGAPAAREAKE